MVNLLNAFSFEYGGNIQKINAGDIKEKIVSGKTVSCQNFTTDGGINFSRCMTTFDGFDAVYVENEITNTDSSVSQKITKLYDCDVCLALEENPVKVLGYLPDVSTSAIYVSKGSDASPNDFSPKKVIFEEEDNYNFTPENGRSSQGTFPFFDLNKENEGYIIAIGWSGQWQCSFLRKNKCAVFKSGIQDAEFFLYPDEKLTTSSVLILHYTDGQQNGHNAFRRLVKKHFSIMGMMSREKYGPLCFMIWGGVSSEKVINRINCCAKYELGYEYCWMDAGWFGQSTDRKSVV